MSFFGQNNFRINHEYHDFYSDTQRNTERIGDLGKVSKAFTDRAYDSFKNHNFHTLAQKQDKFIAPDEMSGTRGREKNRNYNRMEYDMPERHDGKEHADVMDEVNKKVEFTVDNILNAFREQGGYTVVSTASAIDSKPIQQKDYDDQINL